MRKVSVLLVAVVLMVFASVVVSDVQRVVAEQTEFVPGEFVVKLKPGVHSTQLLNLGALRTDMLSAEHRLFVLRFVPRLSSLSILNSLKKHPMIEYAEPNYIYTIGDVSVERSEMISDPDFSKLWGLHNTGQKVKVSDDEEIQATADADIDALEAWAVETGSKTIKVAIIDTGIDYTHEDLAENILKNDGEMGEYTDEQGQVKNKETDKVDNDGNGFIDDVYGWNFSANTNDPKDDHSHGTHVAGTIGAVGNNNIGVVGVNWRVSLLPVKFLSSGGSGTLEDAVKAIEYARSRKVHIMSNSWGGGGFSQALADVIEAASKDGILFIAAAGNSSTDNDKSPHYPSSYESENVIAVAATDSDDQRSTFSSYGKTSVDIAAPGSDIYSTVLDNKYGFMSGTSMATPHVSGVAALVWAHEPNLTMAELKTRLFNTSDEILMLKRRLGYGRVNVYNALTNTIPTKTEPTDPSLFKEAEQKIASPHDYENGKVYTWKINHSGALRLRVHFEKFDTESGYDFVSVKDKNGKTVDYLDGKLDPFWSFEVEGDTLEIVFKTDPYVAKYGFDIDKYQYLEEKKDTPTDPKKKRKPKPKTPKKPKK